MTAVEPPAFKLLTWADLERMPLKSRAQSFREKIGAAVEAMPAVETRGDKLGRILWRGRQWSVTEDGLEALDGCYFIAKNRLAEKMPSNPRLPDWPTHVCLKTWVDAADFITAFLVALVIHGHARKFNTAVLREHLAFCERGHNP
jgi:hypothetical protein